MALLPGQNWPDSVQRFYRLRGTRIQQFLSIAADFRLKDLVSMTAESFKLEEKEVLLQD